MTRPDQELAERVAKEIGQLHKGRGLQAGDLDSRIGPLLGELAGTTEAAARRQALTAEINRCASQLLDDYRVAVGASLALSAETIDEPLFTRRASWYLANSGWSCASTATSSCPNKTAASYPPART
jgi:hypothetical protein